MPVRNCIVFATVFVAGYAVCHFTQPLPDYPHSNIVVRQGAEKSLILRPYHVWKDDNSDPVGNHPAEDEPRWLVTLHDGRLIYAAVEVTEWASP